MVLHDTHKIDWDTYKLKCNKCAKYCFQSVMKICWLVYDISRAMVRKKSVRYSRLNFNPAHHLMSSSPHKSALNLVFFDSQVFRKFYQNIYKNNQCFENFTLHKQTKIQLEIKYSGQDCLVSE